MTCFNIIVIAVLVGFGLLGTYLRNYPVTDQGILGGFSVFAIVVSFLAGHMLLMATIVIRFVAIQYNTNACPKVLIFWLGMVIAASGAFVFATRDAGYVLQGLNTADCLTEMEANAPAWTLCLDVDPQATTTSFNATFTTVTLPPDPAYPNDTPQYVLEELNGTFLYSGWSGELSAEFGVLNVNNDPKTLLWAAPRSNSVLTADKLFIFGGFNAARSSIVAEKVLENLPLPNATASALSSTLKTSVFIGDATALDSSESGIFSQLESSVEELLGSDIEGFTQTVSLYIVIGRIMIGLGLIIWLSQFCVFFVATRRHTKWQRNNPQLVYMWQRERRKYSIFDMDICSGPTQYVFKEDLLRSMPRY